MNQISMIGPNMPPIQDVPLRWMRNSTARMTTVKGTTACSICGAYIFNPSIALNTEIAGVIVPSP